MYASPFEYARAGSWAEAVERIADGGEDARAIAGGQSLAPMMMLRMSEPALLVDVGGAAPRAIERRNGTLLVPALARHADLEASAEAWKAFAALPEAAACIGNVRVRHRGTIGGSLAHADPSAELPCVAVAARAHVRTLGPSGERTVPAAELFVSHFTTTLEHGELITHVEVPALREGEGCAFAELVRRPGDFATVEACAVVQLDAGGRCSEARLVVGATADRPLDVTEAIGALRGEEPEAAAEAAARAAAAAVEIGPSAHGSEEYRREMVAVFARRALLAAAARARGEEDGTWSA
ncbi:MAG TPA: FAD binding domain-containing protein [Solirubrobacteraceae bacterium]|nr:FAD binding domain-containing protein [Solirubrobacteraceae bacterium]